MDKICKSFFKFPYFCVLRPAGAHKLKIEFWKKRDLEKSQAEPVRRLRLTAAGETSLDLDLVALGKDLLPLGQNELQHPVLIGGPDGVLLDAVQGEGPGEAAGAALPADVVVGGGAVIGLVLGRDGEHAVLYIQIDVLLAEAGQVGLEQVVGALVPDISAEDRRAAAALAE